MVIKMITTLQNLSNNLYFGPPILAPNLLPFLTNFELATSQEKGQIITNNLVPFTYK
jgi:hypothetical protein